MEMIKSGLLPCLSESLPIRGVAINAHIEKMEKRSPFWKSERPYLRE
jgi:hypothetical protein